MPREMTPGIDLNLAARLATNRTSRRRFIGGSAAAAAAAVLGPSGWSLSNGAVAHGDLPLA